MSGVVIMERQGVRHWSRHVEQSVLWFWSTGDTLDAVAEFHDMSATDAQAILRRYDALSDGGRDRAAGIAARLHLPSLYQRWIAVETDVVAMAVTRSEAALIAMRDMLDDDGDIENDRRLTIPLLLGLARALDPDGDEDGHWRASGRLAVMHEETTDALATTRRLADGSLIASMHGMSIEDGLLFLEAAPRSWLHAAADGIVQDYDGHVRDAATLARLVQMESSRDAPS